MYVTIAVCTPPTHNWLFDWKWNAYHGLSRPWHHRVLRHSTVPVYTDGKAGWNQLWNVCGFRGTGTSPSFKTKGRTATKDIVFDVKTWLLTETAARRCQVVFIFIFRLLLKPLVAAQASEREIIRGRMCRDVRIWSSDVKIRGQFRYRAKLFLNSMFLTISQLDTHSALSFCRVYVIGVGQIQIFSSCQIMLD